jgi:aryl-alcohol dehydrogenase-like predicted oxidoreductase
MAEDLTMSQMAIAWVLQNDNVASAITGGSRPDQVASNAQAAGHHLSDETMTAIDRALASPVTSGHPVGSPHRMAS